MYNENNQPFVTDSQVTEGTVVQPQAPTQAPTQMPPQAPPVVAAYQNPPAVAVNPYTTQAKAVKKPPREYSVKEIIFAWASFILAYLFTLSLPVSDKPLGAFVVIVLMYMTATVVMLVKGKKPQLMPVLVAASALVCSTSLIITSNGFLHFFSFLYAILAYCYYIYGLSSDHRFRFADSIVIDFTKALFVLPFYSFSDMFVALFKGGKNKGGKTVLKILIGLFAAVLPTMIVFALLSYDEGFTKIIDRIFNFDDIDFSYVFKLILALPIGAYVYGIYISSAYNKCSELLTPYSCRKSLNSVRFAPMLTVLTASIPMLFIYVVFFVSQWKYYVSGFTGVLPKGFSYAQYAREGFFQLCAVSVINLIIIVAITLFTKRKADKGSVVLKLLSVVFSVFTLVLISTAVAKMAMYIDCYGLTPLRVYASWFMIVLAVVFVLIIVKQFVKKFRLIALSLAVVVLMFSALALSGVDEFIAKYNVDRYLDGSLPDVDVEVLSELSDAAVPELVRLYDVLLSDIEGDSSSSQNQQKWELYLEVTDSLRHTGTQYMLEEQSIWAFTVPSIKAQIALDKTPFYIMR